MTMSIINPVSLTDAMLISSTAPETDYPAWNAATNYTLATRVIRTVSGVHKNFENLLAGVDAGLPEATPARWLDLGADNRWKMFDTKVGTKTTLASPLTVVMKLGSVGGIAMMELTGTTLSVSIKDVTGGTVVYTSTTNLDGTLVTDFFDWFYADYLQLSDVVLTDIPAQYVNAEITITLTSSTTVACGVCVVGKVLNIGTTQYGATVGIVSYSKKDTDAFGNTVVTKRANSKRNSLKVWTEKSKFNYIYRALAALDSIPAVYIATEQAGFEPLLVYGFYKDFSIDVAYVNDHLCNLEIEGLI